jgi:hypothetical protein
MMLVNCITNIKTRKRDKNSVRTVCIVVCTVARGLCQNLVIKL